MQRLTSFGASVKRAHGCRGFRGVGRLAGIGYCQELTFRARSQDDCSVNELRWDCKKLKNLLMGPAVKSASLFAGEFSPSAGQLASRWEKCPSVTPCSCKGSTPSSDLLPAGNWSFPTGAREGVPNWRSHLRAHDSDRDSNDVVKETVAVRQIGAAGFQSTSSKWNFAG